MSSPQSIAFFDFDHTLINGNSGYYTSLALVRHGILKKRRMLQAVYYSLAALLFQQDVKKIYEIAIADMAGHPLKKILEIGEECFEKEIKKRFFSDGLERLKEHQIKGDRVVILSSGPSMTLAAVTKFLKIDEAYTMGPEMVDGVLTAKLKLPICHAEGKLIYAEKEAVQFGIPLSKCSFYSDHFSDIPLLEKVGHPYVVNPDKKLKKTANNRGWPVLKFS